MSRPTTSVGKCARSACANEGVHPHRDLPGLYCRPCGVRINAYAPVDLVDLRRDGRGHGWHVYAEAFAPSVIAGAAVGVTVVMGLPGAAIVIGTVAFGGLAREAVRRLRRGAGR